MQTPAQLVAAKDSHTTRKARLREISGFALISVGVTGLVVPFIPGIPLIAAGVGVLGSEHSFVRHWRSKLEERGLLKAASPRS